MEQRNTNNIAGCGAKKKLKINELVKTLPKTLPKGRRNLLLTFKESLHHMEKFKRAKLCTPKSSAWYIEYYYLIPNTTEYKRFRETLDINRIRTRHGDADAILYGKEAEKFMNDQLASGVFNPFTAITRNAQPYLKVEKTLELIRDKLCDGTTLHAANEHKTNFNRLTEFIKSNNLSALTINEFYDQHAVMYREWLLKSRKLSATTINKSLAAAAVFWSAAKESGHVKTNVFKDVIRIKKGKGNELAKERFEPFTAKEMETVFNYLQANNQKDFANFLLFIYYAWARPVEISRLKIADIRLDEGLIRFNKAETKNKKSAFVQIVPPLKEILTEMKLDQHPGTHYLFSSTYAPGTQKLSKSARHRRWNSIKRKTGIDKDMYGLKHTGNIDYILQHKGKENKEWQQRQNRHSSSAMTDRYCRKLGIYIVDVGELNFKKFI